MMGTVNIQQTYYELLEIKTDANQREIDSAYRVALETYSPDSPALYTMFTPEEAGELRRLIEEAYRVLSNDDSRRRYDLSIGVKSVDKLPDLKPDPAPNDAKPTQTKPSAQKVPEGFAKTQLSVYEIDPHMEERIHQAESFDGALLKRIREYKRIELEPLSELTRVSKTYLRAVENDDSRALPAPVFVRGFVVQLARLYGLNESLVAKSYMDNLKQTQNQ